MNKQQISTHDILPGDVIMTHGALFEIETVTWYSATFSVALQEHKGNKMLPHQQQDLDIEMRNGACVACTTRLLNDGGSIPRHWLQDWIIQGNRAATWTRIVTD